MVAPVYAPRLTAVFLLAGVSIVFAGASIDITTSPDIPGPTEYYTNLQRAVEAANAGDFVEATRELTLSIQKAPATIGSRPDLIANLYAERAYCLSKLHATSLALSDSDSALKLDSRKAFAHDCRARCLERMHQYGAALREFQAVAQLARGNDIRKALNSIAWLQATCPDAKVRNGAAAVASATRACELGNWKEAATIDTLAAAYAAAGDFNQAALMQQRAIERAGRWPKRADFQARLALYQSKQAYIDRSVDAE